MTDALAASITGALLGWQLGPTGQQASNRFSLEGLTVGPQRDGMREFGLQKLEAVSLVLAAGPFTLEVERLSVHGLVGKVRVDAGTPRLSSLEAQSVELPNAKANGPLVFPQRAAAWSLGPLAAADGLVQAGIVDAHLLFDADVKVPIRSGRVDFNEATVEHVGPDSHMGVSRMGLYVDAPNGRSYLYQFPAAAVAGVEYERRGTLLGPLVSNRGQLELQPFVEGLLRQGPSAHGPGFTEQSRLLLDRTALRGDVQLGDGSIAAPGVRAELAGRAEGRNALRLHSQAVGRGVALEMASFAVRQALLHRKGIQFGCDAISGALLLRLAVEGANLRFALELADVKVERLRLQAGEAAPA